MNGLSFRGRPGGRQASPSLASLAKPHVFMAGISALCSVTVSAQQYQPQQYGLQQNQYQQYQQQPYQSQMQPQSVGQAYTAPAFRSAQNGFVRPAAGNYFQSPQFRPPYEQPRPAPVSIAQLRTNLNAAMRVGQWPSAIANAQALRLRETQPLRIAHWLHVEAVLLTKQQSWQLAEVRLREALKLSGSDPRRMYLVAEALSVVMMSQGRWADAAVFLRDVEPRLGSAGNPELRYRWQSLRGLAGYQSGDYVEAAGLYGQLMQSRPRDAAATIGFARTLERLKRYQVAMLSYRRVLKFTGADPVLRRYALQRLRKITGAG